MLNSIPGVMERIDKLRRRHQQLAANIAHYEERVSRQAEQLDNMYQSRDFGDIQEDDYEAEETAPLTPRAPVMTKEDLLREEQEIRELERKKKGLEERVTGMEKDLGGLMR
ncbi:hypothetical protein H2203_004294 [Taxawa tesnikishii (nom. ined.)]|nr:hypothetical protein H2203_004294 [Dothideales sp. JES 119]